MNRPNGGKDWTPLYREIDIKDFAGFYRAFMTAALQFVDERAGIYIWHAFSKVRELLGVCEEMRILVHQNLIWAKPVSLLGYSTYPWRHESCLFGWRQGSRPRANYELAREQSTVLRVGLLRTGDPSTPEYYSDLWEVDYDGRKSNAGAKHPTAKPTELFAIPMRVHTDQAAICLEPFSGSGSQIIAGERTGRRVFAIELEPHFCDVAVRRWEDFTGRKAERVSSDGIA